MEKKYVFLSKSGRIVSNVFDLPRIGAGHDGIVYLYGDSVLKILKYDIKRRKEKDLMTFEKANYFLTNLSLKRIAQPRDVILNSDGVYVGYVMKYFEDITKSSDSCKHKTSGSFLLSDLYSTIIDLKSDFCELTANQIMVNDINRGSYIVTNDFLTMCDMDKFRFCNSGNSPSDNNRRSLQFFFAKWLFYEMEKSQSLDKDNLKVLMQWVKKCSNSCDFLDKIESDCLTNMECSIGEYADHKMKQLIYK